MEYKTEDYKKKTVKTSSLGPDGITFVYKGMTSKETKFSKDMYLVDCLIDGEEADILFNSTKLAKIFTTYNDEFLGQTLKLVPEGAVGVAREYRVIVV